MKLLFLIFFASSNALALDSLSYSGRLVNANGSPVTGTPDIRFNLSYTNFPAIVICTKTITTVPLTKGVFHAKLDYTTANCGGQTLSQVLALVPPGETIALQVTDLTNSKAYTYQAIHSIPSSIMANIAKTLTQMGAATGQVLTWNGSKWAPAVVAGATGGTVTSVATGAGLTGGPITAAGTISIAPGGVGTTELANAGVTDAKIASGISRSKLLNGTPNYVLMNNGSGVLSEVAQLPIAQGGTGAATVPGAWTNLGIGSSAAYNYTACMPGEVSKFILPGGWSCIADSDSLDNTKLPLNGSVPMSGALDMNNNFIVGVATATAPAHAANKAYVDAQVSGVNASQWTTSTPNIYFNTGNVGIGTATPGNKLVVAGLTNITDGSAWATGALVGEASGKHINLGFDTTSNIGYIRSVNAGTAWTDFRLAGEKFSFWTSDGTGSVSQKVTIDLNGNVGIANTAPTEKLDVAGNIALTGKVRLKSDNANFVELKAPSALASTLILNLPGTAGVPGNALITDGAGNLSWATVATGSTSVGGDLSGTISSATIVSGAVTSTKIADGTIVDADISATAAIAQSKIFGLGTDLAAKEPTIAAGTTLQYWRGDKSWQTLNSAAVPELTNLYFTKPRVLGTDLAGYTAGAGTVTATDTVLSAIGKLDGNQGNYVLKSGDTMSGALVVPAPTLAGHATNKNYVDTLVSGSSHWTKVVNDINYTTGNVGIGTSTPDKRLHVAGPNTDAALVLTTPSTMGVDGVDFTAIDFAYGGTASTKIARIAANVVSGGGGNLKFQTPTGGTANPYTTKMVILRDGNVGIGTSAPNATLEVKSSSTASIRVESDQNTYGPEMHFRSTALSGRDWRIGSGQTANSAGLGKFFIHDFSAASDRLVIDATGNIGIGTINPVEKLDVAGNIALTGKLRLKSDTVNYIELKAPATLASTLTLNLPGTVGASGNALITDGVGNLSWGAVATSSTAVGGDLTGTISNAQLAAGAIVDADVSATAAIAQSKIANLTADLAAKEPTIAAGVATQYWRGDKTWQTLNTTAVPEGTNLYFLDARVRTALMSTYAVGTAMPLATTDNLIEALGKLEAQIIANKTAFDNTGQWSKNGTSVYYNTGHVGIGTNVPVGHVASRKAFVVSDTTNDALIEVWGASGGKSLLQNVGAITYMGSVRKGTGSGDVQITYGDGTSGISILGSSGNVGIGTTTPSAQLHLGKQEAAAGTAGSITRMAIQPFGHTGGPWNFKGRDDASKAYLDILYGVSTTGFSMDSSGNVGIGTSTPRAALDVNGSVRLKAGVPANDSAAVGLSFELNGDTGLFMTNNTSAADGDLHLYSNATSRMTVLSGGNVGIGTISPDAKLKIQGGVNNSSHTLFINERTRNDADNSIYVAAGSASGDFVVKTSGNVGIGTTSPQAPLHVMGSQTIMASGDVGPGMALENSSKTADGLAKRWVMYNMTGGYGNSLQFWAYDGLGCVPGGLCASRMSITDGGFVGIGINAPAYKLDVRGGNVNSEGAYTNVSDRRLKEKIIPLEDSLQKIIQLNSVSYVWKNRSVDPSKQVGFIAQEVEKVFPELVKTDDKGFKAMSYSQLVSPIVGAIKELYQNWLSDHKKIKQLEKSNAELMAQNQQILRRLDKLEADRAPASIKKTP